MAANDPIVYLDTERRFRWQLKAKNGEIEAASHQGFYSEAEARANMRRTAGRILSYLARTKLRLGKK